MASVQFSSSVVSDSLRPHELQHARPPCPSPTPRVYSNSMAYYMQYLSHGHFLTFSTVHSLPVDCKIGLQKYSTIHYPQCNAMHTVFSGEKSRKYILSPLTLSRKKSHLEAEPLLIPEEHTEV